MVTTAIDPHSNRTRWLRRSAAAAIATVVLGLTGTGLAVGILSARQPDSSGGTQATSTDSGDGNSSSDDSGSSSQDNGSTSDGSGLGSAQQNAPAQGGSNGS